MFVFHLNFHNHDWTFDVNSVDLNLLQDIHLLLLFFIYCSQNNPSFIWFPGAIFKRPHADFSRTLPSCVHLENPNIILTSPGKHACLLITFSSWMLKWDSFAYWANKRPLNTQLPTSIPTTFYKQLDFRPHPCRLPIRFIMGSGTAYLAYPLKPRAWTRPVYTALMVIWKWSGMFSLKASRLIRVGHT